MLGNWQCHLQEFSCNEFLLRYCLGNKKGGGGRNSRGKEASEALGEDPWAQPKLSSLLYIHTQKTDTPADTQVKH